MFPFENEGDVRIGISLTIHRQGFEHGGGGGALLRAVAIGEPAAAVFALAQLLFCAVGVGAHTGADGVGGVAVFAGNGHGKGGGSIINTSINSSIIATV